MEKKEIDELVQWDKKMAEVYAQMDDITNDAIIKGSSKFDSEDEEVDLKSSHNDIEKLLVDSPIEKVMEDYTKQIEKRNKELLNSLK